MIPEGARAIPHKSPPCFLMEIKFMEHKVNHFQVYHSVALSSFTPWYDHDLYLVPKHSHHPKGRPHPH